MSFNDLTIEDYTDKSLVVQGDTRKYKEDLKKLGGKYNGRLKNGPGWIFPKTSESDLLTFIKKGKRLVTADEAREGEERSKQRAQEWDKQTNNEVTRKPKTNIYGNDEEFSVRNSVPTLTEYGSLINMIKKMSSTLDQVNKAMSFLLTSEQKKELEMIMKPSPKKISAKSIRLETNAVTDSSSDIEVSSDDEVVPRKRLLTNFK